MAPSIADYAVRTFLKAARERLEEAAAIAHAAAASAEAGGTAKAVEITNGIDDAIAEADQLLSMAVTINRLSTTDIGRGEGSASDG